jgi:hypothetical protein
MNSTDTLTKYLHEITGATPLIERLPRQALTTLPLFLSRAFELRQLRLFGDSFLIATPTADDQPGLRQLVRQREALSDKLGSTVVLVLPQIKSYERKRLIEKRVPFIVPGRQLFLPMLLIDLRERFPTQARPKSISWVAQVLQIRQLVMQDMEECPLSHIAKLLGYTPMAISQAVDELVALQLCDRVRAGRAKLLQFPLPPRELWRAAAPRMRSPVKKSLLARRLMNGRTPPRFAGMTALAEYTDLVQSGIETFALSEDGMRNALADGTVESCELEEDAVAVVESWAYMPELTSRGPSVDPLSLYLCYREDRDERIQLALEQLLEMLE